MNSTAFSKAAVGVVTAGFLIAGLPALPASALTLEIPVACDIGAAGCVVQNYVDADPGPDRLDFACGALTYDGHKGTDFRVANLAAMRKGVAVLAAADGVVSRLRDGTADNGRTGMAAGQEAGNAVVISHPDGWETQYNHMKQGSIKVRPGQTVKAGTPLGEIGLSGNTAFPHLDLTVRHGGTVVDPFRGEGAADGCQGPWRPLWSQAAAARLRYPGAGLIQAGFAGGDVDQDAARRGDYDSFSLSAENGKLTFWVESFGLRPGDVVLLQLVGPQGQLLNRARGGVPRPMATVIASVFTPVPSGGWSSGSYRGTVRIERDGKLLTEVEKRLVAARP